MSILFLGGVAPEPLPRRATCPASAGWACTRRSSSPATSATMRMAFKFEKRGRPAAGQRRGRRRPSGDDPPGRPSSATPSTQPSSSARPSSCPRWPSGSPR
ncbi:MAG: hypothetical protein MZV70_66560 [Desulfobacterales bacterium]|nr:hypothetical protein [Desulfobacterales bacterium]